MCERGHGVGVSDRISHTLCYCYTLCLSHTTRPHVTHSHSHSLPTRTAAIIIFFLLAKDHDGWDRRSVATRHDSKTTITSRLIIQRPSFILAVFLLVFIHCCLCFLGTFAFPTLSGLRRFRVPLTLLLGRVMAIWVSLDHVNQHLVRFHCPCNFMLVEPTHGISDRPETWDGRLLRQWPMTNASQND